MAIHRTIELGKIQKLLERHPNDEDTEDLRSLRETMAYDSKYYREWSVSLNEPLHNPISHEKCALYEDLIRGRMVVVEHPDFICDLVGCGLEDFIHIKEIKGKGMVIWTDEGPRLVNKQFDLSVPAVMFYDHFPPDCAEVVSKLKAEEDSPMQVTFRAYTVQLDKDIIPIRKF